MWCMRFMVYVRIVWISLRNEVEVLETRRFIVVSRIINRVVLFHLLIIA